MVCELGTNVIICGPPRGVYKRIESRSCPECETEHGFIERWDGAWYGTTDYGACGDYWQEGWRAPRPFQRGWRKKAQEKFRSMWDHAAPEDLYRAYVQADIEQACCSTDDQAVAALDRRSEAHRLIVEARQASTLPPESPTP